MKVVSEALLSYSIHTHTHTHTNSLRYPGDKGARWFVGNNKGGSVDGGKEC